MPGTYESSDLSVSRLRQEQHSVRFARATIWTLALALIGFTIWAGVTPVYEVVNGSGQIKPTGLVQSAEHFEGGIVTEIHIEEGDIVKKGQILISLDQSTLQSELETVLAEEATLAEKWDRAQAFGGGTDAAPLDADVSSSAEGMFRAAQINVLTAETNTLNVEIANLATRESNLGAQIDIAQARRERFIQLQNQGLVVQERLENANSEVLGLLSELSQIRGERAVRTAAIAQLDAREAELTARFQRESALEVENLGAQLVATRERRGQIEERLLQSYIKAPIDGTVQVLGVTNSGQVVAPGAVVAEIVPTGTDYFAEIEVSADSISGVVEGREASLKVVTHDFTRFGDFTAIVERVSPTSIIREDGSAVFRVKLSFDGTAGRDVSAGMTVTADIRTDRRTVLEYLLKPLRVVTDSALNER